MDWLIGPSHCIHNQIFVARYLLVVLHESDPCLAVGAISVDEVTERIDIQSGLANLFLEQKTLR